LEPLPPSLGEPDGGREEAKAAKVPPVEEEHVTEEPETDEVTPLLDQVEEALSNTRHSGTQVADGQPVNGRVIETALLLPRLPVITTPAEVESSEVTTEVRAVALLNTLSVANT